MVKFSNEIHLVDSCIYMTTPDGFLRNEDCFKQKYFVCGIDESKAFIEHSTGDIYFHNINTKKQKSKMILHHYTKKLIILICMVHGVLKKLCHFCPLKLIILSK